MATRQQVEVSDLAVLLDDWARHLRARNLSPRTIHSYRQTGEEFAGWLAEQGMPTGATAVTREHIEAWLGDLRRLAPATVARHYRNLQQLWRWLLDDGEITRPPMERMRPPQVPEQPVPLIAETDLVALLAACKGNTYENRRDTAILRLLIDSGIRLSELTGLGVDDLDFDADVAHVLGRVGGPGRCRSGTEPGTPYAGTSGLGPGTRWPRAGRTGSGLARRVR